LKISIFFIFKGPQVDGFELLAEPVQNSAERRGVEECHRGADHPPEEGVVQAQASTDARQNLGARRQGLEEHVAQAQGSVDAEKKNIK
jgi:hypothetical protein